MKLALCLEYPIGERGGVCVLVETLLQELVRHGHELVLVSSDTPDSLRASEAGRLAREHISWLPLHRPSMANAQKLARRLADSRLDLAHFHLGGNYGWGNRFPFHCPVVFLDRLGVPCLSTSHLVMNILDGYCGPQKPVWFKALMLPLAWWGKMQQLRHVRREIAVSRQDYQRLCRWYWPVRKRFVQVYHSRIAGPPPAAPDHRRKPIILSVGHVAQRKGQPILAEAFARISRRHPEWRLFIAGPIVEPGCQREIEQAAAKCSLAGSDLSAGPAQRHGSTHEPSRRFRATFLLRRIAAGLARGPLLWMRLRGHSYPRQHRTD